MGSVRVVAVGAKVGVVMNARVMRLALVVSLVLSLMALVTVAGTISLVLVVGLWGESMTTVAIMVANTVLNNLAMHKLVMVTKLANVLETICIGAVLVGDMAGTVILSIAVALSIAMALSMGVMSNRVTRELINALIFLKDALMSRTVVVLNTISVIGIMHSLMTPAMASIMVLTAGMVLRDGMTNEMVIDSGIMISMRLAMASFITMLTLIAVLNAVAEGVTLSAVVIPHAPVTITSRQEVIGAGTFLLEAAHSLPLEHVAVKDVTICSHIGSLVILDVPMVLVLFKKGGVGRGSNCSKCKKLEHGGFFY